ncbi:Bug family tripartite tricarboxylate transporter substrate binding protein [Azohydromonas caseinilytica]|uniref:Tripartite tricarboxylate transporter substrate binding protein n=1 Tax=Azohydromonas caseinilytica TaxID=2728836 RepID=A0A848FEB3_9BURK|nr:tripartite tricarboxylate transporter substrate binding protein [Azohydromonas caseinilytica]NML17155.1 tripartite tricarboxylate transporter substrate binding protein [Azohydromonas caseinilytica]
MQRRHLLARAVSFALLGAGAVAVQAQEYPSKPVTLIVSFSAGGNNDLRARQLGVPVGQILKQTIVVDNKPGASGNIGHEFVSRAAPDGHTLGIGAMGPLAVNPSLFPKINFNPKDFVPVVLIEKAPLVLVTRADKPFKSFKDVVAAAKAKPGAISIGNAGTGGAHHLSAELMEDAAGLNMLAVPYKGGGPAANALLSGEIDMMFEQTYAALPSIQAGKTRALAVTSDKRLPSLPDVPTMAELGYPQVTVSNWLGIIAPKGTPQPVVQKLNQAFNQALSDPALREKISGPGNVVGGGSPEEFRAFIEAESRRWGALIKAKGIRME